MSCYHPRTLKVITDFETGEAHFKFSYADGHFADRENGEISIPCGECIGCRLDKSRSWADRMMLELDHSKTGVFVTLTYDNDHLPVSWCNSDGFIYATLVKRDVQLFMKRLRFQFSEKTIRFYLAGEYGPSTLRPHYHAILFGLSVSDFPDAVCNGKNPFGQSYFSSDLLTRLWSNGFTCLSDVSWRTCAYVARYVQKKAFKDDDVLTCEERGVLPEFSLMSRKPGLAGFYYSDHPDCFDSSCVYVSNPNDIDRGAKKVILPKYVMRHLQESNPDLYFRTMEDRQRFLKDREILSLQNSDLDVISYYEQAENNKLSACKKLFRKDL